MRACVCVYLSSIYVYMYAVLFYLILWERRSSWIGGRKLPTNGKSPAPLKFHKVKVNLKAK